MSVSISLILYYYPKFPSYERYDANDTDGAAAHAKGSKQADDDVLCCYGKDRERQQNSNHYSEYSVVCDRLKFKVNILKIQCKK